MLIFCADTRASVAFDDRGLGQNCRVAEAYRNFLTRSKLGRSFSGLLRTPFFSYSQHSVGIQLADLVCTIINRFYTDRVASPRIPVLHGIVRQMEWHAKQANEDGYLLHGIKIIGG